MFYKRTCIPELVDFLKCVVVAVGCIVGAMGFLLGVMGFHVGVMGFLLGVMGFLVGTMAFLVDFLGADVSFGWGGETRPWLSKHAVFLSDRGLPKKHYHITLLNLALQLNKVSIPVRRPYILIIPFFSS